MMEYWIYKKRFNAFDDLNVAYRKVDWANPELKSFNSLTDVYHMGAAPFIGS